MKTKLQNPSGKPNLSAGLQSHPKQSLSNTSSAATATTGTAPAWRGVFFDGPEPEQDREGEEIPVWHVYVGDTEAEPVGRVYRVFSFAKAESLAQAISHDRRLELVSDAMPA
ncbi:MAG: hypothetical protein WCO56_24870 [Verrucomicrobiota bacterium]